MIDGYYNSTNDNKDKPVIPWHTDQAYSGSQLKDIKKFVNPNDYTLKFFIYLTDVYKNNGCMSYIPGSHKITYLIRKGIYEKKLDYAPYWSIDQIVDFISLEKNKNYILKNLNEKIFLIISSQILKKLRTTIMNLTIPCKLVMQLYLMRAWYIEDLNFYILIEWS